mmetsp:Transcript_22991/g.48308  ORF Transcript_22991/g.48308 Transcript_22991/m.48308 type:complete len:120 (+) Transcript_22991:3-362(+)
MTLPQTAHAAYAPMMPIAYPGPLALNEYAGQLVGQMGAVSQGPAESAGLHRPEPEAGMQAEAKDADIHAQTYTDNLTKGHWELHTLPNGSAVGMDPEVSTAKGARAYAQTPPQSASTQQ